MVIGPVGIDKNRTSGYALSQTVPIGTALATHYWFHGLLQLGVVIDH
ncbi:MAG: hypothetical protein OQL27_06810 [Sedimenticola sp.]|nr:hypothetical protein [Sedimenticola sp.]